MRDAFYSPFAVLFDVEVGKLMAVESCQAMVSAQPEVAPAVLDNRVHHIAAEPLASGEVARTDKGLLSRKSCRCAQQKE